jgi:prefoldin beta subunit
MKPETQEKINQLQVLEQNLQSFLSQKQQFQTQLAEVESASKELKGSKESYKIVGNIMVSVEKKDLETELSSKKEMLELRLKSVEKQENKIKQQADDLQKEVLAEMQKNKK